MGMCGDEGELTPPLLAHERAQRQLCTQAVVHKHLAEPTPASRPPPLAWAERGRLWGGTRAMAEEGLRQLTPLETQASQRPKQAQPSSWSCDSWQGEGGNADPPHTTPLTPALTSGP